MPLTFRFKGMFPDTPAGQPPRALFHATAALKRGDFGMTRDNLAELGPKPEGDQTWRSKSTWRPTQVRLRSNTLLHKIGGAPIDRVYKAGATVL